MTEGQSVTRNILEIRGLTSQYGRIQALFGIDLCVGEGQLVALIGANGAGKTTLLHTISGVQPVTRGEVWFLGENISKLPPDRRVRRGICQVAEGRQVFGPMSVEDNVRLGAYTRPKDGIEDRLAEMYELFPVLKRKRHLPASTLSGGEQQMMLIARALLGEPTLLLLDEPSLGLAPLVVDDIFRTIEALKARGMNILLVEQNARRALAIADTGYVMETGRIVIRGSGRELLDNEDVKRAYLGM